MERPVMNLFEIRSKLGGRIAREPRTRARDRDERWRMGRTRESPSGCPIPMARIHLRLRQALRRLGKETRRLPKRVGREGRRASLHFLALLLPIPLLPDREVSRLAEVNPRLVWLVVVFIAGLSLLGYLLAKVLKPRGAIGVSGLLGGCVSPSLTVAALAEQNRRNPDITVAYALAAAVAATVLFPRVLVLVWIVSSDLARSVALPLGGMTGAGIAVTVVLWLRIRDSEAPEIEMDAPFRIVPALAIGGVVGLILAGINLLDLSIPSPMAETGIVLVVVGNLLALVGIAGVGGAWRMAAMVGVVTVCCSVVGIGLVLLV